MLIFLTRAGITPYFHNRNKLLKNSSRNFGGKIEEKEQRRMKQLILELFHSTRQLKLCKKIILVSTKTNINMAVYSQAVRWQERGIAPCPPFGYVKHLYCMYFAIKQISDVLPPVGSRPAYNTCVLLGYNQNRWIMQHLRGEDSFSVYRLISGVNACPQTNSCLRPSSQVQ